MKLSINVYIAICMSAIVSVSAQSAPANGQKKVSGEVENAPVADNNNSANRRRSWFSFFGGNEDDRPAQPGEEKPARVEKDAPTPTVKADAVKTDRVKSAEESVDSAAIGTLTEEEKEKREKAKKRTALKTVVAEKYVARKELLVDIHQLRVKLLEKDKELQDLHKKILGLHQEMALKMDKNKEMRALISKLNALDEEIMNAKNTLKSLDEPKK